MLFGDIGTRIKVARKANGLTLKEAAELTGISVSYISDMERGRTEPSLHMLRTLHNILNINLSEHNLSYDELKLIDAWRNDDLSTLLIMIAKKCETHP